MGKPFFALFLNVQTQLHNFFSIIGLTAVLTDPKRDHCYMCKSSFFVFIQKSSVDFLGDLYIRTGVCFLQKVYSHRRISVCLWSV